MQRIITFATYYPNRLFLISLLVFVYAVLYAFVSAPFDALIRSMETVPHEVFEDERTSLAISEIWFLLFFGRPWLALGIGLVAGVAAFAWMNKLVERRFSELVSGRTARVLRRVRERSFARVKSNYPLVLVILALVVCSVTFGFSLKISLFAMGATMWFSYPADRRIFDAVTNNLSDVNLEPDERKKGARWIRRRRYEAIFSAVAFPALTLLMVFFLFSNLESWIEFGELVEESQHLLSEGPPRTDSVP